MTKRWMNPGRSSIWRAGAYGVFLLGANFTAAQTPSPALLVLEKSDHSLAIVDPENLQIVARVAAGPDPHEIVASPDGKLAYISNYGGLDSALNTISVIDLAAQKALPPIYLGALRSAHGLAFAGGKLYFTVETNKAIGRYDPATQSIDWVLGTGQDRTHMVVVSESLDRIVTSNVSSGTISIIEQVSPPATRFGPPPGSNAPPGSAPPAGGPRKTWRVTNVPAGHGAEGFHGDDHRCHEQARDRNSAHFAAGGQPAEVHPGWKTGLDRRWRGRGPDGQQSRGARCGYPERS